MHPFVPIMSIITILHVGHGVLGGPIAKTCPADPSCDTLSTTVQEMAHAVMRKTSNTFRDGSFMSSTVLDSLCDDGASLKACVLLLVKQCFTERERQSELIAPMVERFQQSSSDMDRACSIKNSDIPVAVIPSLMWGNQSRCDAAIAKQSCDSMEMVIRSTGTSVELTSIKLLTGVQLTMDDCKQARSSHSCIEKYITRCEPHNLSMNDSINFQIRTLRRSAAQIYNNCNMQFGSAISDSTVSDLQQTI